ncbi:rRNA maturation RNase YbeY [Pseudomonadota bacterium]
MNIEVDVQVASKSEYLPTVENLSLWATTALSSVSQDKLELTVRLVDEYEMQVLNRTYRHQDKPTNVLSFPFDDPPGVSSFLLGDVLICAPVVEREAKEFGLTLNERWAHLVVHGVLHLCGYDHMQEIEADEMMQQELRVLKILGFEGQEVVASVLGAN